MEPNFNTQLDQKARLVNNMLEQLLSRQDWSNDILKETVRYTLQAGGKRIRSALVLFCCELVRGRVNHNAQIAAAAVEMVHTYSLVHDDLPAMDDDDFRRGLPTCHKAFGEGPAILTGDALLTLAFEVLAKEISKPALSVKLISQLAADAGQAGMIGGQMTDISLYLLPDALCIKDKYNTQYAIRDTQHAAELLHVIHTNKTAKMFRCAAAMGAICGRANPDQFNHLCEYGLKIGLGFQVADDILDVCSSIKQLGKRAGKDAESGKMTYPAVIGVEKSKQLEKKLADEAAAILKPFGPKADTLRQLATALLERTK